jgi:hypothetical protein
MFNQQQNKPNFNPRFDIPTNNRPFNNYVRSFGNNPNNRPFNNYRNDSFGGGNNNRFINNRVSFSNGDRNNNINIKNQNQNQNARYDIDIKNITTMNSNDLKYEMIMYLLSLLCMSINNQDIYNTTILILNKFIIQKDALSNNKISTFDNFLSLYIENQTRDDEIELPIEPGKRLVNRLKINDDDEDGEIESFITLTKQDINTIQNFKKSNGQIYNDILSLAILLTSKSKNYQISFLTQMNRAVYIIKNIHTKWTTVSSNVKKFIRDTISMFCVVRESIFLYEKQITGILNKSKQVFDAFKDDTGYEHVKIMKQQIQKSNINIIQIFHFLTLELADMMSKNKDNINQYNQSHILAITYIEIVTELFNQFKKISNTIENQDENTNIKNNNEDIEDLNIQKSNSENNNINNNLDNSFNINDDLDDDDDEDNDNDYDDKIPNNTGFGFF